MQFRRPENRNRFILRLEILQRHSQQAEDGGARQEIIHRADIGFVLHAQGLAERVRELQSVRALPASVAFKLRDEALASRLIDHSAVDLQGGVCFLA